MTWQGLSQFLCFEQCDRFFFLLWTVIDNASLSHIMHHLSPNCFLIIYDLLLLFLYVTNWIEITRRRSKYIPSALLYSGRSMKEKKLGDEVKKKIRREKNSKGENRGWGTKINVGDIFFLPCRKFQAFAASNGAPVLVAAICSKRSLIFKPMIVWKRPVPLLLPGKSECLSICWVISP